MEKNTEDKKELVAAYKEASELNEFETPYVPTVAAPLQWSVEKYKAAELMAFSGKTKKAIAKELGLPPAVVSRWTENAEFMEAVNRMVADTIKDMKNERIRFLKKILAARMEQAEQEGYADASRKDTVEIIAELRKEAGEDPSRDSNYARFLEKLVLSAPTPQIINLGGE
jgi:predicted transcriptional regulator